MRHFLVRQLDDDESSAQRISHLDAREAAIAFVSQLEARQVYFPVARGDEVMKVIVASAEIPSLWWLVAVCGDPHPCYDADIIEGCAPGAPPKEGTDRE